MGGAPVMEQLKRVTYIVMDKTGTLTEGRLRVSQIAHTADWRHDQKALATLICAAEECGGSAHPVGAAIFRTLLPVAGECWKTYKESGGMKDLKEIPGRGVSCQVDAGDQAWHRVCVGTIDFMADNSVSGITTQAHDRNTDGTTVYAAINGALAVAITLRVRTPFPKQSHNLH